MKNHVNHPKCECKNACTCNHGVPESHPRHPKTHPMRENSSSTRKQHNEFPSSVGRPTGSHKGPKV